jgi:CSLREA domain-containing protein
MSKNIHFPTRFIINCFLITVLLFGVALIVTPVHAANITVNSTADVIADDSQCTLREAITAANTDAASGGTTGECAAGSGADTITLPAGTYTLTITGSGEDDNASGDLDITSDITINGASSDNTIIQVGSGGERAFHVVGSSDVLTLNGVTVRYGKVNGGGVYNSGTLTVNNSVISNNRIGSSSIDGFGGGVHNRFGTVTVNNSVISDNSIVWLGSGGGVYNFYGTVTVNNSTISNNWGGERDGGGVFSAGTLTVNNSIISDNSSGEYGGGVYNGAGTLTIQNSTISGNTSDSGGGVYNRGTLNIGDSTISSNTADDHGGGVTLIYNYADGGVGGGIDLVDSTVHMDNCTISGNRATDNGGGLSNHASTTTLVHCTISNNRATQKGGGISQESWNTARIYLKNTIVVNNASTNYNANRDCAGQITSGGHNLVGSSAGCPIVYWAGDQSTYNPKLGGLQDNGGLTKTRALLSGSPALNAIPDGTGGCGSDYTSDQRGIPRPIGGACDVGAYEPTPSWTLRLPSPVCSLTPTMTEPSRRGTTI